MDEYDRCKSHQKGLGRLATVYEQEEQDMCDETLRCRKYRLGFHKEHSQPKQK